MTPGGTAVVVAAYGRRGLLELPDGQILPYQVKGRRLQVCCGDRVHWNVPTGSDTAQISAIERRRNQLARQPGRQPAAEIIAVNVTHLVVVLAPLPAPDLFLTDRYACAAHLMGCEACIAYNKLDLVTGLPPAMAIYPQVGIPIFHVSATTGEGLAALRHWLGQGTGILVGQSGVGKSSLLNALAPGAAAATSDVSAATDEGRHTTTASVMHRLSGGGRLVDTPGVRDFVPAIPDRRDVAHGFSEIAAEAGACRFANCLHLREPGCAVIAAVEAGSIDDRRYESFRRMMIMAAQAAERAAPGSSPNGRN